MLQTHTIYNDKDARTGPRRLFLDAKPVFFGNGRTNPSKAPSKETIKAAKTRVTQQELENLANKSEQILLRITNVFPFAFFPDELIIDELKVNIINRIFFFAEQLRSILIKDIVNVVVETGPFFATLVITDRTSSTESNVPTNIVKVKYLKKNEATTARRIIQGLKISYEQKVDLASLGVNELTGKLEEIGRASDETG